MIILFTGPMGAGKTLLMTYYGYLDYCRGHTLLSNYSLFFGKHNCSCHESHWNIQCPHGDNFVEICKSRVGLANLRGVLDGDFKAVRHNSTYMITELQLFLESRRSISKQNVDTTHMILQSRKMDIDLFFDTQRARQVDVRVRENVDILMKLSQRYNSEIRDEVRWKMILVNDALENPNYKVSKYRLYPKPIFDLYNTKEIVDPLNITRGPQIIAKSTQEEIVEEVEPLMTPQSLILKQKKKYRFTDEKGELKYRVVDRDGKEFVLDG